MYVCAYIRMYIHTCIHTTGGKLGHTHTHTHTHTNTHTPTHTHTHTYHGWQPGTRGITRTTAAERNPCACVWAVRSTSRNPAKKNRFFLQNCCGEEPLCVWAVRYVCVCVCVRACVCWASTPVRSFISSFSKVPFLCRVILTLHGKSSKTLNIFSKALTFENMGRRSSSSSCI